MNTTPIKDKINNLLTIVKSNRELIVDYIVHSDLNNIDIAKLMNYYTFYNNLEDYIKKEINRLNR